MRRESLCSVGRISPTAVFHVTMETPVLSVIIIRIGLPSPRKLLVLSADIGDLQIATIDLGEISSMRPRSHQLESIFAFSVEES